MMKKPAILAAVLAACLSALAPALLTSAQASPIPDFDATALNGERVRSSQLIGQPTILIVTPSKGGGAAQDTREWGEQLPKLIDTAKWRIRAVLAIDLPFFMDERDALSAAREKIPPRYHDQTWLTGGTKLEHALGIPTDSDQAVVLVLDATGEPVVQVSGAPTQRRLRAVEAAAKSVLDSR